MKTHTKNFGSINSLLKLTSDQGRILVKGMIAILFVTFLFVQKSSGQAFSGTYAFTSVTTSSGTTDPTTVPTATGVTFSSFTAVGQTTANPNAASRFSFTGQPLGATNGSDVFTGSISTSQYYQVSLTVAVGFTVDLSSITFTIQRSGTGIRQYAVRSSQDGFAANLPASVSNAALSVVPTNVFQITDATTTATTGNTVTLTGGSFTGLTATTTVTFRFYGWNAEAAGGTFSIDDVVLNGTATSTATPVIALSSPSQIATGNILQGVIDYPVSNFQADVTVSNAILNTLSFVTGSGGGSYSASDIINFKLYYNPTSNVFGSATQIGTTQSGAGSGSTVTFGSPTSLNKTINNGASGFFWITASVSNSATAGNIFDVEANPTLSFLAGTPTGTISAGGAQTITTATPTIDLSNGTVAAGNISQNTINNLLYQTNVNVGVTSAILNSATITTAGTYTATDLTNLKLWYSTSTPFVSGSSTLLATLTSTMGIGAGPHSFSGLTQTTPVGTSYLYVTADVPCAAVTGNTINVNAISTSDITYASGTPTNSGGFTAGGTQTIIDATPVNVTLSTASATATGLAGQVSVQWTNPSGCFTEVLIVEATAANTGTPSGDGSAYTPGASNSPGTALGNGFVVYKGSTAPQTITGLTNETQYFFKIFTRNGTTWSSGTEINGTPVSTIYLNTFTGLSACPTNGNVPVMATNSSGAALSRNTIICAAAANVFNSTTLNNTASPVSTSYIEFSATAAPGYRLDLTSLTFFRQGSATAPNQLEVAYSTDGFATQTTWGAAPVTPAVGTVARWDFADFSTPTGGTITFRVYPYGTTRVDLAAGAASTGSFRLDDVTINGTVTIVPAGPIALSAAHPSSANIGQGSSDNIIGGIRLDVTGADAYLTGVTVTTAGTYLAGDVATNGLKVWLSPTAGTISGATQLGTNQPAVDNGNNVSVSGFSSLISAGTTRYIYVTATIAPLGVAGHTFRLGSTAFANIIIPGGTFTGTDPVSGGATPTNDQTIFATTPLISLSNGTVAGGNIGQGTTNNVLYRADVTIAVNAPALNSATFTTAGTYLASDISNLQLWYSTGSSFVAGSSTLLGTLTTTLGAGSHTFSSLSQSIPIGTEYLYVTTDVPCSATLGNAINVNAISTGSLTFSAGSVSNSGGFTAGGTQTIIAGTPVDVSAAAATGTGNSGEASVSWTNPPPCFDEVLIVAATAPNSGTPTGDGSSYTPGALNSPGTALGNGFVVYKGSVPPQTITGLTNGVLNYFKIFSRFGSNWSAGVEVSTIPFFTASAGNVVVLQMGNGTEALAATGNSIHLKQYTSTGSPTLVSTVDLPTSGCTPLIAVGNSTAEGYITLSSDRDFLIVPGYVTTLTGAPTLSSSTATLVNRGIGRVDASGNYSLAARSANAVSGSNFRAAVSDGNNNFWGSGSGVGLFYFGTNPATNVTNAPIQNIRVTKIINGNLYFSSASAGTPASGQPFGIWKVGAAGGLPTTSGVVAVNVIPTGATASPYGFDFNSTGDVCYVADDRSVVNGGGIQKWTLSGSVWSLAYTLSAGGTGVGARGLTVNFNGTFPVIYATSSETAPTVNRLFQITDLGSKIASDPTLIDLSSAPAATQYRGVAFAPIFDCANAVTVSAPSAVASCGPGGGQINISVSGGTSPYSYAWSNVSGSVCATTQNLAGVGAGTYTVQVTDVLGHCYSTASSTVTEYPLPAPVVTGTLSFCPGFSTTLDAGTSDVGGAYTSYVWSPGNETSQTLSVNTPGQYSVSVTNVNGCVGTSTVLTVTQNIPPSPTIAGNSTVCAGGHIILDAGAGYSSYSWSPGGAVSQTINVTAAGNYTVTVSDANGCTGTASKNITLGNISITITGSLSYCAGSFTTLSVPSGFASYAWSSGQTVNSISATAGTYSVTVSDGTCFGTSPSVLVTQNSLPTVNIAPASPPTVCMNTPVSLTASGSSVSYLWSPASGLSANTGATVSATPANTTVYTVAGTDNNGCVNTASVSVSVFQLPPVAVSSPVSVVCSGSSTSLTASGATTYTWSPSTYLNTTSGSLVSSVTPAANIVYTVTGTDGNNCKNTATANVVVTPILAAPTASPNVPYCQNASASALAATPNPSNATLLWYTTPTGTGGSTVAPVPSTATAGQTDYYVSQSIGAGVQIAINGYVDNRTPDLFSFVALADIPANTNIYFTDNGSTGGNTFRNYNALTAKAGSEDMCFFHAVNQIPAGTVVVSYSTSPNYTWTSSGAIGGTAGGSNDYGQLSFSTGGDQIYAFLSNNPNDPMNPASISRFLFVFDITNFFEAATSTSTGTIPTGLSISEGTAVTVLGDTTIFTGTPGAGSYFSLINDGQYRSAQQWYQYISNTSNYAFLPQDLTTALPTSSYNVAASCESPRTHIVVDVTAAPFPDASSNTPVCEGTDLNLTCDPQFLYTNYAWTGPGITPSNSTDQSPVVTSASVAASGVYSVTVTEQISGNGCTGTQAINVVVQPCGVTLNMKMFIEGFYSGGGLMELGGAGCLNIIDPVTYPDPTDADDVTITAADPVTFLPVETHVGRLKTNGNISVSFTGPVTPGNSYYIQLTHRNFVETWSKNPVLFTAVTTYDFTSASTQAYDDGFNFPMRLLSASPVRWGIFSGDIDQDGGVTSLDMTLEENDSNAGAFGYNNTDLNGDGGSDSLDMTLIENNGNQGVFEAHP